MSRTTPWIQPATIVVVDDDPISLGLVEEMIQRIPNSSTATFDDPALALAWCQAASPDVIVSDYQMPGMDGLELVGHLRAEAHLDDVPIMMVTSMEDRDIRHRALELGANDFLGKPLDVTEVVARIKNMVLVHQAQRGMAVRAQELNFRMGVATSAAADRERELIIRLAEVGEYRDWQGKAHALRVAHYCRLIARELGLSEAEQDRIFVAAPLHDVGKVAVPDHVLLKPGPLDHGEFEIVKQHTIAGYQILADQGSSDLLRYAAVMARTHHERMDGRGYPDGLKGEQIPLSGRILSVADAFDALTSPRPYRAARTIEEATVCLQDAAGSQFDGACVTALLNALPEVLEIRRQFPAR